MCGCLTSLFAFVVIDLIAAFALNRLIAIWQDTHQFSFVAAAVLLVSVVLLARACVRMEAVFRRACDASQHEKEEEVQA